MATTTRPESYISSPLASVSDRTRTRSVTQDKILLGLITLLAVFLRLHALTAKTYWLDETISVRIARMPWPEFFAALWHREANMAFYYLLLHLWLAMGHTENFIRGLSVLFSIATIPAIYALTARLFNSTTALLAAFLLAINAFHIRYAQEARGYALAMFCATLAAWLLVRNLQEPTLSLWGAYSVICALTVYSHFYGVLVVIAHCIALGFLSGTKAPWNSIVRSLLWFSCLTIPITLFIMTTGVEPLSWVQPVTSQVLLRLGIDFSGNYGQWLLALDVFAVGMAVLEAVRVWRANGRIADVWRYVFVLVWLFVPVAIVLIASLIKPFFVGRFLSICMPALIILVASGIARLRPPVLAWILFTAIAGCSILGTISYYHEDFDLVRGQWREMAVSVLDRAQPGDSVFFYQPTGLVPFEFYRWQKNPYSVWPRTINPQNESDWNDPAFVEIPGTGLRSAQPAEGRVWLVLFLLPNPDGKPDTTGAIVRDWLAKGRYRMDVQRFMGVDVVLYGRASNALTTSPAIP